MLSWILIDKSGVMVVKPGWHGPRGSLGVYQRPLDRFRQGESKSNELCIKNEKLCIKNEEFCI